MTAATTAPRRRRRPADSYTPPQLARRYGVKQDKVLGWIRSGELQAINIASRLDQRPRYVITPEQLAIFEINRQARPEVKPARRQRRAVDYREYL